MNSKLKQLFTSLVLGLGLSLAILILLNVGSWPMGGPAVAQAANQIRYVAPGGTDGGNLCSNSDIPCATVQHAVDIAAPGDEIRVAAGTYTDVVNGGGVTQTVYISKTVTIRGGYTTTNWSISSPTNQPTTLDGQGQMAVMTIVGTIAVTIEGLRFTGGRTGVGIFSATAILRNNSIYNNNPAAGVYSGDVFGETTLIHNSIYSNASSGVYLYGPVTLVGNVISGNNGGGVVLVRSISATLSSNLIDSNFRSWTNCGMSPNECKGGGVLLYESDATLSSNTISRNWAELDGGGVALESSTARLNNNKIFSNTVSSMGGGVSLANSQATLKGNLIAGNEADVGGGVSIASNAAATLEGNIILGNKAVVGGGGMYVDYKNEATLTNTIIADNQTDYLGSGLYIGGDSIRLWHTTIARNRGDDGSGLFVANGSTVALTNTILVSHTVGITVAAGGEAMLENTLWGSKDWANGADWGGAGSIATGTVNLWDDPAFAAPEAGNYHLSPNSAALDEGVEAGVTVDIDGEARPFDAGYDLGADEGQPNLTVTKQANAELVQAGAPVTYTIRITNSDYISLTTTITDILPDHVTPTGIFTWTPTITAPGGVWTQQVVVTAETDYTGPLTNVVRVATEEGATGIYTQTSTVGRLIYLPVVLHKD